jgi:hypothetical protein
MPITPEQIGWSNSNSYEGPFFHGVVGFNLPDVPNDADRYIAVITAAEGGHYDAINMYDRGIISVGVIQWIEAGQFSVSSMLGEVCDKVGPDAVLVPLKPALDSCNATFKKNAIGQWRFHFLDAKGEVNDQEKTRILFLGCTGLKGTWTPGAKARAKLWAACIANVWSSPEACKVQNTFTSDRLKLFIGVDAKKELFGPEPSEGWVGTVRAAYMTFAINAPAIANAQLKVAIAKLKSPKWSPDWCIGVLKQMTFGPNITIYPVRYNGIRPVLEQLWGVTLPKTARDLSEWQEPAAAVPVTVTDSSPARAVQVPRLVVPEPPPVPPAPKLKVKPQAPPVDSPGSNLVVHVPRASQPKGVLGFLRRLINIVVSFFRRKR